MSAHWEAPEPTVMTSARPPMLYDYYGFPPAARRRSRGPRPASPCSRRACARSSRARGFAPAPTPSAGSITAPSYRSSSRTPTRTCLVVPQPAAAQARARSGGSTSAMGRALAPLRDGGRVHHRSSGHGLPRPGGTSGRAPGPISETWCSTPGCARPSRSTRPSAIGVSPRGRRRPRCAARAPTRGASLAPDDRRRRGRRGRWLDALQRDDPLAPDLGAPLRLSGNTVERLRHPSYGAA